MDHKEMYAEPLLTAHDMLRDITGTRSGYSKTFIEKSGLENNNLPG